MEKDKVDIKLKVDPEKGTALGGIYVNGKLWWKSDGGTVGKTGFGLAAIDKERREKHKEA